jgi:hypothetical protein
MIGMQVRKVEMVDLAQRYLVLPEPLCRTAPRVEQQQLPVDPHQRARAEAVHEGRRRARAQQDHLEIGLLRRTRA